MRADIRDPESVAVLRPLEVASYLRASGWAQAEAQEGRYAIWTLGDDYEAFLPLRHDVRDYALRMGDLLGLLSKVEDRSQLAILSDLLVTGADVIRVRIADDDLADGSMPIEEHTRTVQKTRDLFMAAACSTIERKAVWHKRKPDQAVNYLRNVRVGQTERGSYVMTVISKVPPMLQSTNDRLFQEPGEPEQPYERKVTTNLALSLAAAERAAEIAAATGSLDSFDQAVRDGVSANLCEALVGLATDSDTNRAVDFSFSWSRNRPAANQTISRIVIAHDRVPYLQEAARQLRERAPINDFEIEGPVVKLERADGAPTGFVTVYGLVDDSAKRVRVELSEDEYNVAIAAHRNGVDVQCKGQLVREGRGYVLRQPMGFAQAADVE
ncbi:MAG: hypothetical protein SGJ20_09240 [Planctomycetota bacterium]|nr:hypothetical protein [Planctomycetota bacterium]